MRPLLLDTIVLLWWLAGDARLDWSVHNRIRLPEARIFVSVATAWEICALERAGQVSFGRPARDCVPSELSAHRIEWLAISHRHVFLAQQIPRDRLDPYDRMILAQASIEGLVLATTNDVMRAPGVEIMNARQPDPQPALPRDPAEESPDERPIGTWNALPWGRTPRD